MIGWRRKHAGVLSQRGHWLHRLVRSDVRLFYACPDHLLFLVLCVCGDKVIRPKVRDDEPQLFADHILHAEMRPHELEYQLLPLRMPVAR
jgi:hypothetical protein